MTLGKLSQKSFRVPMYQWAYVWQQRLTTLANLIPDL